MTAAPLTDETFRASADAARWREVLARIGPHSAIPLDDALHPFASNAPERSGRVFFPAAGLQAVSGEPPSRPAIGVMVDPRREDLVQLAAGLAALALERDCDVVAISRHPLSGLERYGIRTERLAGETPEEEACCLGQIRRFWGMEIVL